MMKNIQKIFKNFSKIILYLILTKNLSFIIILKLKNPYDLFYKKKPKTHADLRLN